MGPYSKILYFVDVTEPVAADLEQAMRAAKCAYRFIHPPKILVDAESRLPI